ncbi:ChbG/HpnK family deacetylase [Clostridium botulinum]|uniref:ChbG/HpnK family deacetylase n=1 Tax=Clostridium botulinum TaxID=1491 RepID=A0A6B4PNK5_CLOBO|nr:ChbG/HpnK family deacetylase [Clostridium botulinum]NFE85048.1 ChbG/HpnK family deacetylase [Clostridium botulinum]NFF88310.1 ChbG/HpnK family deacetylase [Clostridium botulinum]NFG38065.1 ChbG/HpnK family deacetylase [Clostridium botulinum]NFL36677.1 ChbG/HpnK family deacetylase [Clostridium botulinum]NFL65556.1 ChbG/HpnK family deacetylase [Clostridium botulinum]
MTHKNIIFHADDYGISLAESKHILDCCTNGKLNSLSVLPNSYQLQDTITELEKFKDKVKISIHLNLVEGHCCSDPKNINLLVNDSGNFNLSFEKLLLLSYSKLKNELSNQLYIELDAQINKLLTEIPYLKSIRLDSHQHFHMIPLVFNTLLKIIKDNNLSVEYIRFPMEPISPFFKKPKFYFHYKPINWIKNILLNFLGQINLKKIQNSNINKAVFFGLVLTGDMDKKYITELLPYFIKIANKKNSDLEVLFHPGSINNPSEFLDINKKGFVSFYTSEGRIHEKETLCTINL